MTHRTNYSQSGFTLVELLIYVGVVGGAITLLTGIAYNLTRVLNRESSANEVSQQSRFVLQEIQRQVRDSSLIDMGANATGTSFVLRMPDTSTTTIYSSGTALYITTSSTTSRLTTNTVAVDSVLFTKASNPPGHDILQIDLTLSFVTANKTSAFSKQFRTAISRVNAAVFDSSLIPGADNAYDVGLSSPSRWRNGTFSGTFTVGTNSLYVNSATGRVGIGTLSPNQTLSVAGTIESTSGGFKFPDGTSQTTSAGGGGVRSDFRGLALRTHPDNDKRKSQVMLVHADEIVLDDAARVADWDNLTADIASSGAGGLDTGSEAASTWYEVYAIYNGSTKNLLLHRAKDYFKDVSQASGSDSNNNWRNVSSDREKMAQGFQVNTAGKLEFIDLKKISKLGTPTGNWWITIESDNAGNPSGTVLATSDKLDASLLSTSKMTVRFVFRSPATLSTGTQYHFVWNSDVAQSDTNNLAFEYDSPGEVTTGGAKSLSNGTWSTFGGGSDDLLFDLYITRNDTSVTMPSGYTGKAKIGYVYNDSGSDLDPFTQFGRTVKLLESKNLTGITQTISTLLDMSSMIPPGDIKTGWVLENTVASHNTLRQVPDGYDSNLGNLDKGSAYVRVTAGTSAMHGGFVTTEYQGIYAFVDAGTLVARLESWEW